ncbi:MAG: hypothetical protein KAI86_16485 [Desulfobacterales bacterium]|nr:hypothetical protein [Desulfobacterales bacterium]
MKPELEVSAARKHGEPPYGHSELSTFDSSQDLYTIAIFCHPLQKHDGGKR